jgi:phage FluMu protein gp41
VIDLSRRDYMQLTRRDLNRMQLTRRDRNRMQLTRRDYNRMQLTREERHDTIAWIPNVPQRFRSGHV